MKCSEAVGFLEQGLAAALICLGATQTPAATPAKAAARPTQPPLSGPGSLNGVWNNAAFKDYRTGPPVGAEPSFKDADGQPIPMRPDTAAIVAERRKGTQNGKPYANNSSQCVTDGMPQAVSTPAQLPLEFLETPGQVTVLYEFFSTFRIIHLNQKHGDDPDPSYMGDAVGHWEGDTLIVDTIAISDKTNILGIIPHSEDLHVVERIRRTGPDTMENRVTIEDPKTFTKPFQLVYRFKRVPGIQLAEYVCDNNRNVADPSGGTGIQLKSSAP